ncbi:hypothetical protein DNK48_12170 [Streptomyces malaysiensis subsp. malaysiensis]|uniref:hypothetical protein n=1 Tax=Streptomyces malaysiensis TaxID=92644 RepID=UPI000BFE30CE|nr:hypothetical protein [Streptomyces malaysiensis]ATL86378.1 hypothetical protein SMALA_6150 [Streptomyces malaysiensis]QDL70045.1 hypothetical protein DNK48_12170 [Streptomyces malaysiensis]
MISTDICRLRPSGRVSDPLTPPGGASAHPATAPAITDDPLAAPAAVGNWTGVHPTGKGRLTAGQLLTSRTSRLTGVLDVLGDMEVRDLGALLAKLLDGLYQGSGSADRMCRLCDRAACAPDGVECPVGAADQRVHDRSAGFTVFTPGRRSPSAAGKSMDRRAARRSR